MENEKINETFELEEDADYIVLTMDDGTQKNFYFEDEYVGVIELEDIMLPQYIDISNLDLCVLNGEVANFRFEILDVYEGDVYEDTCITGVDFKFREPK